MKTVYAVWVTETCPDSGPEDLLMYLCLSKKFAKKKAKKLMTTYEDVYITHEVLEGLVNG